MIVYVETNFLLEIAYVQEGCESCRGILNLAAGDLSLMVPAFALVEARQTWSRRNSEHKVLRNQLQPIIRQLARSEPFSTVNESSSELLVALVASGEDTRRRLEETIDALTAVARVLPLSADVVARARQEEMRLALSPPDAVVYASVLSHLEHAPSGTKCFLNRDTKDFAGPSISEELARYGCKLIPNFDDALKLIRSEVRSADTAPTD